MITVAGDGRPKAAKIEAAFVDGRLASSSQADKVRTRRLRHDPQCTLYFADDEHRWLALEAHVEIIDGPAAPGELLRYFRTRDRNPDGPIDFHSDRSHHTGLDDASFLRVMTVEHAVLYRFTITKTYGNR
jgi:hypothetical protein